MVDNIKLIYYSHPSCRTDQITLKCYREIDHVDDYENVYLIRNFCKETQVQIGIDSNGDFSCYIYRVVSNLIDKNLFQRWILNKCLLKNDEDLHRSKQCFFNRWQYIRVMNNLERLESVYPIMKTYNPKTFTSLLDDVHLYVAVYENGIELPRDITLFDIEHKKINYKKTTRSTYL